MPAHIDRLFKAHLGQRSLLGVDFLFIPASQALVLQPLIKERDIKISRRFSFDRATYEGNCFDETGGHGMNLRFSGLQLVSKDGTLIVIVAQAGVASGRIGWLAASHRLNQGTTNYTIILVRA